MTANKTRAKVRLNETHTKVSIPSSALEVAGGDARARQNVHQIEMVPLKNLRKSPQNARSHPKRQIEQIANSIRRFGFITPIVVDSQNQIRAGHGRADAAKLIGMQTIPILRVTNLTEPELRAFMLADNRIAEGAGWDRELLAIELNELQVVLPEIGLDLSITGFEPSEIDSVIGDFAEGGRDPDEELPDIAESATAKAGDLFHLGNHRLIVGDARDRQVYNRLMRSERAEMAFFDPPYNVPVQGNAAGHGRIKYREFAHGSGEFTSAQFTEFLTSALSAGAGFVADGAVAFCCMDWRHVGELMQAGAAVFDELLNVCVWVKSHAGLGSFYRSAHEFVFVFKKGKAPHINTFGLGKDTRNRTNVWRYPANLSRAGQADKVVRHPTIKPIAMIADAMRDCSRRSSIILDSFSGSGSTIMAAEQVGRRAYCVEIDPIYVDVAIRRWQRATKRDAILGSTGETFDELCRKRG
jgi:DNA methylase/ParB-like nuclease domain